MRQGNRGRTPNNLGKEVVGVVPVYRECLCFLLVITSTEWGERRSGEFGSPAPWDEQTGQERVGLSMATRPLEAPVASGGFG